MLDYYSLDRKRKKSPFPFLFLSSGGKTRDMGTLFHLRGQKGRGGEEKLSAGSVISFYRGSWFSIIPPFLVRRGGGGRNST